MRRFMLQHGLVRQPTSGAGALPVIFPDAAAALARHAAPAVAALTGSNALSSAANRCRPGGFRGYNVLAGAALSARATRGSPDSQAKKQNLAKCRRHPAESVWQMVIRVTSQMKDLII